MDLKTARHIIDRTARYGRVPANLAIAVAVVEKSLDDATDEADVYNKALGALCMLAVTKDGGHWYDVENKPHATHADALQATATIAVEAAKKIRSEKAEKAEKAAAPQPWVTDPKYRLSEMRTVETPEEMRSFLARGYAVSPAPAVVRHETRTVARPCPSCGAPQLTDFLGEGFYRCFVCGDVIPKGQESPEASPEEGKPCAS